MHKYVSFLVLLLLSTTIAFAQSLFEMPRIFPTHLNALEKFLAAASQNNLIAAEEAAQAGLKVLPQDANWNYNLACVYARREQLDEAMTYLQKAVECGFQPLQQLLQDEDIKVLHTHPQFQALLQKVADPTYIPTINPLLKPAQQVQIPEGTDAIVSAKNTQWMWHPVNGGYFTTHFTLPEDSQTARSYTGPGKQRITTWASKTSNYKLLYVNRDEDQTLPNIEAFPAAISVYYDDEAVAANAHVSIANGIFMTNNRPIPTIGNTVLAIQRLPFWRTLPRLIATNPKIMAQAYRFAFFNQLYFYDATIDVTTNFRGDILPFMQPFYFTTADFGDGKRPLNPSQAQTTLVEYAFAAVEAMQPEARQAMFDQDLFVWTIQRLFREAQKNAKDIYDPLAHPIAFDPQFIDFDKLITNAHALTPETLPPMFRIMMHEEKYPTQYVDYFDPTESERFGDTSMSVSRVVRDVAYTRKMVLTANSAPGVTFQWFVVNGIDDKIRIEPKSETGSVVEIEVDWHGEYKNRQGHPIRRVDIACVAKRTNGATSAPAFLSLRYLANEHRTYENGRLISIDYRPPETGMIFEDPALTAQKHWKDEYHYHNDTCIGWTRFSEDKPIQHFNAKGERLSTGTSDAAFTAKRPLYSPRINPHSDGVTSPAVELLEF